MPNMRKLKAQLIEKDVSVDTLANQIGVDKTTLYRWISNNGENITIKAANIIYQELQLTPETVFDIFFGD